MLVAQDLLVHDSLILLCLIGGTNISVANDVELRACVVDVLEANTARVDIDVEAFARGCEVRTDTMRD